MQMSGTPDVSVVIPTRDRECLLARALDGFARQTLPAGRFEVLVVRDESQAEPLTAAPAYLDVRFLQHRGDPRAAAAKRNLGWRAARSPLVAFTDDDCRPTEDWLERVLAHAGDGVVIQGRTEVDPLDAHLLRGLARAHVVVGPSPWYETCNIVYPKQLLEAVGGFDEAFFIYGEDTDLGLRALDAGACILYADDAVVRHAVHPRGPVKAIRDALSVSSLPLLFSRHPGHRRHLFLRAFRNRSHAAVVLALIGIVFGRGGRRAVAASFAPYSALQITEEVRVNGVSARGIAGFIGYFPIRMIVDICSTAATVRIAVSHRVFMA